MTATPAPEHSLASPAVQRMLAFLPERYSRMATVTQTPGGVVVSWDLDGCRVELEMVTESAPAGGVLAGSPVA